jgi:hypothetical protein
MSQCLDYTFSSDIRLQSNLWSLKANKNETNMSEITFSKFRRLLRQNLPEIKDRNSG